MVSRTSIPHTGRPGRLVCFSTMYAVNDPPPAGLGRVVGVSVDRDPFNGSYICAISAANRSATCWPDLHPPGDMGQVASLAVGGEHVCALTANNTVRCWGSNRFGQCDVPALPPRVVSLSSGNHHSCVLLADKRVVCWGDYQGGPPSNRDFASVVAGEFSTCTITTNLTGVCWPGAGRSQSYYPSWLSHLPQAPSPEFLGPVVQFGAPGLEFNCALRVGGVATCWGNPKYYDGLDGLPDVRLISVGWTHACAVLRSGALRCFGVENTSYMNPLGVPQQLKVPGAVLMVVAGPSQTCAVVSK